MRNGNTKRTGVKTFDCPWCGNEISKNIKDTRPTTKCRYCGEIIKFGTKTTPAEAYYETTSLKNRKGDFW